MNLSNLKPPAGQKQKKQRIGQGMGTRPREVFGPWRQGRAVHFGLQHHARV